MFPCAYYYPLIATHPSFDTYLSCTIGMKHSFLLFSALILKRWKTQYDGLNVTLQLKDLVNELTVFR